MRWPIAPSTFTFALVVAAFVVGWAGINTVVLVPGVIGAIAGAAALESTGWEIDAPRAAAAMLAGAIIAAVLARLVDLVGATPSDGLCRTRGRICRPHAWCGS
jgi:ABC-type Fe3+-siderophore transport system permease subunit